MAFTLTWKLGFMRSVSEREKGKREMKEKRMNEAHPLFVGEF